MNDRMMAGFVVPSLLPWESPIIQLCESSSLRSAWTAQRRIEIGWRLWMILARRGLSDEILLWQSYRDALVWFLERR
ncbi:MAG: hypothetical protein PVF54_07715 [Anaerolineae bacterium]